MAKTYKTIDGTEYDLSVWPKEHLDFARRAYWWYCSETPYETFVSRILGPDSPVLKRKTNGSRPTRTPLYGVVTDLQARLGVKQGCLAKDWDGPIDPEWPLEGG